ncbi:hypothetical protein OJ253_3688 [Cryptosporidium canis]|uniref:Nudix hydrolase domain-containing protein n=1 Tax=Cryptosporidium canis TaxID=195482 RepID=A0A9D5DJB4_9CRYT|nr:hypothetical protein OJ253_3688 [Cryptosporidium canis]
MSVSVDKFRSFVIAIHDEYGCLLLKSSKKGGDEVFQLPGGRLEEGDLAPDKSEVGEGSRDSGMNVSPRDESFRVAAARELYEETGLDFRSQLQMLKKLNIDLPEKWRFFYLNITNFSCPSHQGTGTNGRQYNTGLPGQIIECLQSLLYKFSRKDSNPPNFPLKLSPEHTDFIFEKDLVEASRLVKSHSKGICSKALLLYNQTSSLYNQQ